MIDFRRTFIPAAAVAAAAALAAPAANAAVLAPVPIDTAPQTVNDIGVAPDGTGALVYAKADGIYASVLTDGTWGAPFRVDPDATPEDQPRVAVGNGGRVLFGYVDGNARYLRWRLITSTGTPMTAEADIRDSGAVNRIGSDWDLDMNPSGVAYAAWRELHPVNGQQIRTWRLNGSTPEVIFGAQHQNPAAEHASDGGNGPDVRVAVDGAGNGTLLWDQNDDKVLLRRFDGIQPSATFVDVRVPNVLGEAISGTHHQLDLDVAGDGRAWAAGSAMYPNGGHSVGVPVTEETPGAAAVLDLHPAAENDNSERPDVALNATGQGLFGAEPNQLAGVWGGSLDGGAAGTPVRLDVANPTEPAGSELPGVAVGDNGDGLLAFTRDVLDGANGPFEVRARRYDGATKSFAPEELLLSNPAHGASKMPSAATYGDIVGVSRLGDAAVLVETDDNGSKRVVVGRYDAPPTAPVGTTSEAASAEKRPTLAWTASDALWSPLQSYKVELDGAVVATVGAGTTSFTPVADLPAGEHTWRVIAVDTLGQETPSAARKVVVSGGPAATPTPGATPTPTATPTPRDTKRPTASLKTKGVKKVGEKVSFTITAKDAGGIASITFSFGDGSRKISRKRAPFTVTKRFKKAKTYKVVLTVRDKAGNTKKVTRRVKIAR